jgi:hypothetical protein
VYFQIYTPWSKVGLGDGCLSPHRYKDSLKSRFTLLFISLKYDGFIFYPSLKSMKDCELTLVFQDFSRSMIFGQTFNIETERLTVPIMEK